MKTIVYQHNLEHRNRKKNEWWWANAEDHKQKHGPFESRAEAEDAAGAARVTAKHEGRYADR